MSQLPPAIVDRDPGDETESPVFHLLGDLWTAWCLLRVEVKALEETRDELADGLREMTISRDAWRERHQAAVEMLGRRQFDLNRLGTELNNAWRRLEIAQSERDAALREVDEWVTEVYRVWADYWKGREDHPYGRFACFLGERLISDRDLKTVIARA